MPKRRVALLVSLAVLATSAAVLTGCGGQSGASTGGKGGKALARRLLDAQGGLRGDHPRLPEDAGRQGRRASTSPTAPRATRSARSRAACRPTSSRSRSSPTSTKLVKAGLVARDWNADKYNGFVTNSVVVFAVRKGNPKNIKTWDDLVKPGVEVITPNPFTSGGAKWNIMAAYGAQIEQGKTAAAGARLPQEALQERLGAGQERPRGAADVHRRQGRRADRLRERGDHRAAEGRGHRLRRPGPDDPDPEPGGGARRTRSTDQAQGVRRLPAHARRRRRSSRRRATAR